jgi:arsenite-transporting ATPase
MSVAVQPKRVAFFLGKGGVGKTTLSSAFAKGLADSGSRTLIASLDPAHNLGDIFGTTLTDDPKRLLHNLDGLEINLAAWVKRYLDETRREMKANYSYQSALNLDGFLNVMKYSPGTEEYAVLWAIEHIWCNHAAVYDTIVFDTPPTALSLRFLALPTISELWVDELTKLRAAILSKRSTLLRLNPEAPVANSCVDKSEDRIYGKLDSIRKRLSMLNSVFKQESFVAVVVNPDMLSLSEAGRIREELDRLGIPIAAVCMNKVGIPGGHDQGPGAAISGLPVFEYNLVDTGIRRLDNLNSVNARAIIDFYRGSTARRTP